MWSKADAITSAILTQCDKLINENKYSSAYVLLDECILENEYIIAKKIDILLKNNVENYLFKYFLLVDDEFTSYRNKKLIIFEILEKIEQFQTINGISGILEYYAGFYYFELRSYGVIHHDWLRPEAEVIQGIMNHYRTAFLMGFYDIDAYRHYALANMESGDYNKSIEYYKKVIELQEEDDYLIYSNLSYAYYLEGDYNNAISNIEKTIEIFKTDAFYCFLEYKMLSNIFSKIKIFEKAKECIDEMINLRKMHYFNSEKSIVLTENYLYLNMNDKSKAMETGKRYFEHQIEYVIDCLNEYGYSEIVIENANDGLRMMRNNYIDTNNINEYLVICEYYLEKYNENEIIKELIKNAR
jgi:tetratricopeptide (TPR) repeat protein